MKATVWTSDLNPKCIFVGEISVKPSIGEGIVAREGFTEEVVRHVSLNLITGVLEILIVDRDERNEYGPCLIRGAVIMSGRPGHRFQEYPKEGQVYTLEGIQDLRLGDSPCLLVPVGALHYPVQDSHLSLEQFLAVEGVSDKPDFGNVDLSVMMGSNSDQYITKQILDSYHRSVD